MMLLRSDLRPIGRPRRPQLAVAPMAALYRNILHALVGSLVPLTILLAAVSAYAVAQRLTCFGLDEFGVRPEIYDVSPIECDAKLRYDGPTVFAALPFAVCTVLTLIVVIRLPRRGLVSAMKWQLGLVASFPLLMIAANMLLQWSYHMGW